MMSRTKMAGTALATLAGLAFAGPSMAQMYVSGTLGANLQSDSSNSGAFGQDFTTGEGGAAAVLPAGTGYGWDTEFETGMFVSGAFGYQYGNNIRVEAELSYQQSDVDTHKGVNVEGVGVIDAADASILITGASNLGVSVGDLVADGTGEITSVSAFVNAYYDFKAPNSPIGGYVGAGVGFSDVDVEYAPSNTPIIDDGETKFAYQLMAGATYDLNDQNTLYVGYRYRATEDVEANNQLFPATTLDIENQANIVEFGWRFSF